MDIGAAGTVERANFLLEIHAASAAGTKEALAHSRQDCAKCGFFIAQGSEGVAIHGQHHEIIGRYFAPFIKKIEGTAVNIASWGFWVLVLAGVLAVIVLGADIRPLDVLKSHFTGSGGK